MEQVNDEQGFGWTDGWRGIDMDTLVKRKVDGVNTNG